MAFAMAAVPGAPKNSYGNTKPVIACDRKGCKNKIEGNAGSDEAFVKERAYSLGWRMNPHTSKHTCPHHGSK